MFPLINISFRVTHPCTLPFIPFLPYSHQRLSPPSPVSLNITQQDYEYMEGGGGAVGELSPLRRIYMGSILTRRLRISTVDVVCVVNFTLVFQGEGEAAVRVWEAWSSCKYRRKKFDVVAIYGK